MLFFPLFKTFPDCLWSKKKITSSRFQPHETMKTCCGQSVLFWQCLNARTTLVLPLCFFGDILTPPTFHDDEPSVLKQPFSPGDTAFVLLYLYKRSQNQAVLMNMWNQECFSECFSKASFANFTHCFLRVIHTPRELSYPSAGRSCHTLSDSD